MTMPAMGSFTTEAGVFTVAPFQFENSPEPFDVKLFGLKVGGMCTSCYRGWLPSYAMWSGRLYLDEIWILGRRADLPDICGIAPDTPDSDREYGSYTYRNLRMPLGFCGDMEVTPQEGLFAWRGDWEGMKIRFTLSFHGGRLRAADNTSYDINTTMNHIYCPPVDRPIDHLPLPDRSTPFDEYVIPLTAWEKEQIAEEAEREVKRRARQGNSS